MNERENQALDALLTSKKYGAVCEDTVRRVFADALTKHKKLKDADKAARTQLHGITGAFMTQDELRAADRLLDAYVLADADTRAKADADALNETLKLHASTRERLAYIDELYDAVFAITGRPAQVVDLACGLNPLYLGGRGIAVRGYDISGGAVKLINRWAERTGWPIAAEVKDVLSPVEYPKADLALIMKLLPVLRGQDESAPRRLLNTLPAKKKLITYPTKTLGGRRVGMEKNYAAQFEALAAQTNHAILTQFTIADELCFLVEGE